MREEAQKEGWAKASKLQNRPMSHGLVGLVRENNIAAMVEVSYFLIPFVQNLQML